MFVLGILASEATSGGSKRPLLFILLVLAILLLFVGAIIALVTLRSQRKHASEAVTVEQFDEAS